MFSLALSIKAGQGKSRRFLIFAVHGQGEPIEIERLDLPRGMSLHHYGEDYPLFKLGRVRNAYPTWLHGSIIGAILKTLGFYNLM